MQNTTGKYTIPRLSDKEIGDYAIQQFSNDKSFSMISNILSHLWIDSGYLVGGFLNAIHLHYGSKSAKIQDAFKAYQNKYIMLVIEASINATLSPPKDNFGNLLYPQVGCKENPGIFESLMKVWASAAQDANHFGGYTYLLDTVKCKCRPSIALYLDRRGEPFLDDGDFPNQGDSNIKGLDYDFMFIDFMLSQGASIHDRNSNNESCLMVACKFRDLKVAQFLVSRGACVNYTINKGHSVLTKACENGDIKLVEYLVSCGANIYYESYYSGGSCLKIACEHSHLHIVEFLVSRGANIRGALPNNDSLSVACKNGDLEIVDLLVRSGANIHLPINDNGQTYLMKACIHGRMNIVEFLVNRGVDIDVRDRYGKTALMLACRYGEPQIVEYLVAHGADINKRNCIGENCFVIAAVYSRLAIIDFLIAKGSDMHCVKINGDDGLSLALSKNRYKVVNRIRSWPTCVAILLLKELSLFFLLDLQTIIDLHHYLY